MTKTLVPLRYPVTAIGERTLRRAFEAMRNHRGSSLIVYHVNLLYDDVRISNKQLQKTVEEKIPELGNSKKITYSVEDSYLLNESILKKISATKACSVVMGGSLVPGWRKFLKFLGTKKVSDEIKKVAECKVIVAE